MTDAKEIARELGLKHFLVSYTDLFGAQRAKLIPASAMDRVERHGAAFGGFATWLDSSPVDGDMYARPDFSSLIQLPWQPEVAWVASDLWENDAPLEQAPRNVLQRAIGAAEEAGLTPMSGVECEFLLLNRDGTAIADSADTQIKACYDQASLMRRYDVLAEISDAMEQLGWQPYQSDHEDAHGQFEMNWQFAAALTTADRHAFFKFMAKSIAEKHGLRATFMPKPFATHNMLNGAHVHLSLWQGDTNLFVDDQGELGLSPLAYHFLGGILAHAEATLALTNPTVNSFKRLNPAVLPTGEAVSPGANAITYGGNNRTHYVRIPGPGRLEIRIGDGAANPYLLQGAMLAAGLDGVGRKTDPGERLDIHMGVRETLPEGLRRLPRNLLDAVRALDQSSMLREALGAGFISAYVKLKTMEWDAFCASISDWERATTLDC